MLNGHVFVQLQENFLAWNAGTGCAGTCTANCATCYSAAASGDTCLTCADTYYDLGVIRTFFYFF